MNKEEVEKYFIESIIDSSIIAMHVVNDKAEFVYVNAFFCKLIGYTKAELLKLTVQDITSGDYLGFNQEVFTDMSGESVPSTFEKEYKRKDNSTFYGRTEIKKHKLEDGRIYNVGFTIDVSNEVLKNQELKKNEYEFESMFNSMVDVFYRANPEGVLQIVSPSSEKLLGYKSDELIGRNFAKEFLPGFDIEPSRIELMKTGKLVNFPLNLIHKKGHQVPVEITASVIVDNEGNYIGRGGIVRSVENENKLKDELLLAKNRLEEANLLSNIGSWEYNLVEETVYWSEVTKKIHEVPIDYKPDLNAAINFYKEGRSRNLVAAAVNNGIEKGKAWDLKLKVVTAKGNLIWVRAKGHPVMENGKCVKLYGTFQDINEEEENRLKLINRNQVLTVIQSLQEDFISGREIEKKFLNFLKSLLTFTDSEYGFIGEVLYDDKEKPYLKIHAILDVFWNKNIRELYKKMQKSGIEFHDLDTLFGATLKNSEIVISNDPANDSINGGLPEDHPPLLSYLGIPITADGKLVGMIGLGNKENGYSMEDVERLEPFFSTYSVLIESIRIRKESVKNELELNEKETLLKEIHHRVKNNMQVISSLLTLTFSKFDDEVRASLDESKSRITTMALVHEQLYETNNLKDLNSHRYLSSLVNHIKNIYYHNLPVKIEMNVDEFTLDLDKAVPMGLIVNEILSNSFKYAFVGGEEGVISISMKENGEKIELQIRDNGRGVDSIEVLENSKSLGFKLISNLTSQLRGTLELSVKDGVGYIITF